MRTSEQGEIVTLLTIGTAIFLGVATIISSLLLKNPQTTTSKAAGNISNSCFSLSADVYADRDGQNWKFNTHVKVFSPENGGDGIIQLFVNGVSKGWNQGWNKNINNPFVIVSQYTDPTILADNTTKTGTYRIKIDECASRGNTLEIVCTYKVVNGQPKVEGEGCNCVTDSCKIVQPTIPPTQRPVTPTRSITEPTVTSAIPPTVPPTVLPVTPTGVQTPTPVLPTCDSLIATCEKDKNVLFQGVDDTIADYICVPYPKGDQHCLKTQKKLGMCTDNGQTLYAKCNSDWKCGDSDVPKACTCCNNTTPVSTPTVVPTILEGCESNEKLQTYCKDNGFFAGNFKASGYISRHDYYCQDNRCLHYGNEIKCSADSASQCYYDVSCFDKNKSDSCTCCPTPTTAPTVPTPTITAPTTAQTTGLNQGLLNCVQTATLNTFCQGKGFTYGFSQKEDAISSFTCQNYTDKYSGAECTENQVNMGECELFGKTEKIACSKEYNCLDTNLPNACSCCKEMIGGDIEENLLLYIGLKNCPEDYNIKAFGIYDSVSLYSLRQFVFSHDQIENNATRVFYIPRISIRNGLITSFYVYNAFLNEIYSFRSNFDKDPNNKDPEYQAGMNVYKAEYYFDCNSITPTPAK